MNSRGKPQIFWDDVVGLSESNRKKETFFISGVAGGVVVFEFNEGVRGV